MDADKTYTGATEDSIWQQISADINEDTLEFHAIIQQANAEIYLDIDIDLGGGFEGGYATTAYKAPTQNTSFEFAVHEEHFIDEIGKFFHMQDVKTGYPDLDKHLVIKTNDAAKVKTLFADDQVRKTFIELNNFDFAIRHHSLEDSDEKQSFLELNIEDGVTDIAVLRQIYHAFYVVLQTL